MSKGIFIAATNQHIGKTTTTLGLLQSLKNKGINVGYCKPLGQQFVLRNGIKVDKDAALFANITPYELEPSIHSPVIMGGGASRRYIDRPFYSEIADKLRYAKEQLEKQYDFVIYEGTGHPGVGSVFDFSNADTAKFLGLPVIIVVKGGIGSTIDRLSLCKNMFEAKGCDVKGVIINKIIPEKIDKVKHYVGAYLAKNELNVYGYIPFEKELAYPLLGTIFKVIKGRLMGTCSKMDMLVQDIIAGSLIDLEDLDQDKKYLLVVSIRRMVTALRKLRKIWEKKNMKPNLAGVVLTGSAYPSEDYVNYLNEYNIPTIHTKYDTYESVIKISQLDVKINPRTPSKISRAASLFQEFCNMPAIEELITEL